MKVAVVGAGVAGLAAVWHLLQKKCEVTVFDTGGSASSVSTGLLHPFPGKQALPSWRADEGMEATAELLQIAESALGRPVAEAKGILRPAITEQQKKDFSSRGIWWEAEEVLKQLPLAAPAPALWIPNGITVYSKLYLQGLWLACEKLGAQREQRGVSLSDLKDFDKTILATGAATLQFEECRHLPLKCTIGQSLICRWPERLPLSLVSQGHITPTEDPAFCQIGSTYEHTSEPDPKKAVELLEKAALFYPPARDYKIVEIRSGVRISPINGYQPLIAQIAPKVWVFTGLGSRGLLYHALLARDLVHLLVK